MTDVSAFAEVSALGSANWQDLTSDHNVISYFQLRISSLWLGPYLSFINISSKTLLPHRDRSSHLNLVRRLVAPWTIFWLALPLAVNLRVRIDSYVFICWNLALHSALPLLLHYTSVSCRVSLFFCRFFLCLCLIQLHNLWALLCIVLQCHAGKPLCA